MKRLILTIIVLFILYFGFQIAFRFQSQGFVNEYVINSENREYQIKEVYTANTEGETDSYHLTITVDNLVYDYSLYKNLNKMGKIITDIKASGNCIYPIFRNNQQYFDITCLNNQTQTYYHDMNSTTSLETFAESLKEYGYDKSLFEDSSTERAIDNNIYFYPDNMISSHYVGIQNYRGLYTINKANPNEIYNNEIFRKDIYNAELSALINNYYLVVDYESSYNFNRLYAINMKNNNVEEIENQNLKISFDSYIQGAVDNSLYLFDTSNIKQYEVDTKSMTITEVGNEDTKILYYNNGEWTRVNAYDAVNNKLYFVNGKETLNTTSWDYQVKIGGQITGNTYYFKKSGNNYKVYKSNGDSTVITYLFDTANIDSMQYISDYVYFINGSTLYYYSDATGVRRLYRNSELQFNKNLKFYIFE